MTNPLDRCRRMKIALESALGHLRAFDAMVTEIANDPFTAAPSKGVLDAIALTHAADESITQGLVIIDEFHKLLDTPANRESIGMVVDEAVRDA